MPGFGWQDSLSVGVANAEYLIKSQGLSLLKNSGEVIGKALERRMQVLAVAMNKPNTDGSRRLQMHVEIGEAAHRAVLAAYDESVLGRKEVSSYRYGQGRFPGALGDALRTDFYRATPEGLGLINESKLDNEARHWKRLNFGAKSGRRGGGGRRLGAHAPFHFGSGWKGSIGLVEDARPAFSMPPGRFLDREGGDDANPGQFYPMFKGGRGIGMLATKGIEARQFLDEAARVVSIQLPEAYEAYYRQIYNEAKRKVAVGPVAEYRVLSRPIRLF